MGRENIAYFPVSRRSSQKKVDIGPPGGQRYGGVSHKKFLKFSKLASRYFSTRKNLNQIVATYVLIHIYKYQPVDFPDGSRNKIRNDYDYADELMRKDAQFREAYFQYLLYLEKTPIGDSW